jgi:hypothetical protein
MPMNTPNPHPPTPKSTEIDDGGLEKKLRDYHRQGGAGAATDAIKSLEGEIALANATNEQRLEKAWPQQSKTANR